MSKNIQEYVARSVIEHMKYRDETIKELEKLLRESADIEKCTDCLRYNLIEECDFCGILKCVKCMVLVDEFEYICKKCYKND